MSESKFDSGVTKTLTTSDMEGNRIYVYPADVRGRFRRSRDIFYSILILIFLGGPWIRIHGHPAILLDIVNRKFAILGIVFWAHEAPLMIFVFGGAALSLGFVTAVWGRVWCGWACPQTVFIDHVFRRVERWIEGDSIARRQLDASPWTGDKALRKVAKWTIFVAFTLLITHSFLAYFVGTEELARMIRRPPSESPFSFLFMVASSAAILFDFGWFREQFCTVLCPYGRFQSVLMDRNTLVVGYDKRRGEPRGPAKTEGLGDCVDCGRCVRVCPTAIDIRVGTQLECVACTACIDACDEIMRKVGRAPGLIRYDSEEGFGGGLRRFLRPRPVILGSLVTVFLLGLGISLSERTPLSVTFVRPADSPFQKIDSQGMEPRVSNRFWIDVNNQSGDELEARLDACDEAERSAIQFVSPSLPFRLLPSAKRKESVFIQFPQRLLELGAHKLCVRVRIHSVASGVESEMKEWVTLVGPF